MPDAVQLIWLVNSRAVPWWASVVTGCNKLRPDRILTLFVFPLIGNETLIEVQP